MSELHTPPVALSEAVERWVAGGSPMQGPTRWNRDAWIKRLPAFTAVFEQLPPDLDRPAVVATLDSLARHEAWPVPSFVVTQVWGYGTRGYGPARVDRVLTEAGPRAQRTLAEMVRRLRSDSPEAALAVLESPEYRLNRLGVAFATKFLFFMDPDQRALVLDEFVAEWLKKHADLRLVLYPLSSREYAFYLKQMHAWADHLGIHPAMLEEVLFAEEAGTRPNSDWAV